MENTVTFEIYERLSKECLKHDQPEKLQLIFQLLIKHSSYYRPYFLERCSRWIFTDYLSVAVKKEDLFSFMPEWTDKHPHWKSQLKNALLSGNLGPVSRNMRESVIQLQTAMMAQ
jgi:hypothetical protein